MCGGEPTKKTKKLKATDFRQLAQRTHPPQLMKSKLPALNKTADLLILALRG